jgi:Zn-dependent protease with chaperone function
MFYLLCICLVFAVMFVVYALATLASVPALRVVATRNHALQTKTTANLLFAFRSFPLALATIASVGLALPSFLRFEPSATREMPGPALWLLAGFGMLMLLTMAWRCSRIVYLTSSLQRRWLRNSEQMSSLNGLTVSCVNDSASLVAVVGIFAPRVFISRNIVETLSPGELDAALSHELAHVSAWDNLRQLVLKVTRFHGLHFLTQMDALWARISELAADERAIAQGASPLNLSSALVKVGRLSLMSPSQLLAASHLVDACSSATSARARHLQDLLEHGISQKQAAAAHSARFWVLCGATLLLYVLALVTSLPQIHKALEFIVR